MNNYKFSMEKVLEWKETIEKEKMEDFARIQNKISSEKEKLVELKAESKGLKLKPIGEVSIVKLQQEHLYTQSVKDKIREKEKNIANLKEDLESERLKLISAQKDKNIIEKLKEKNFSLYKKKMSQLEQKELDEIAVLRHNSAEVY